MGVASVLHQLAAGKEIMLAPRLEQAVMINLNIITTLQPIFCKRPNFDFKKSQLGSGITQIKCLKGLICLEWLSRVKF